MIRASSAGEMLPCPLGMTARAASVYRKDSARAVGPAGSSAAALGSAATGRA